MTQPHERMSADECVRYTLDFWADKTKALPALSLTANGVNGGGEQLAAAETRLTEIMAVELPDADLGNPCEGIMGTVTQSRRWLRELLTLRREAQEIRLRVLQHWRARRTALTQIEACIRVASAVGGWDAAGEQIERHLEPLRETMLKWDAVRDRAEAALAWVARLEVVSDLMMTPPSR